MSRTSSRRLTALALIAFLGLSLPVSAATSAERHPGVMDRLAGWAESLWSLLAPDGPAQHGSEGLLPAFNAVTSDHGPLIDPNGGG